MAFDEQGGSDSENNVNDETLNENKNESTGETKKAQLLLSKYTITVAKNASELVLDFQAVRFMDSSGIALILGRAEVARSKDATLTVQGLPPVLMKLVRLSGVDRVENIRIVR